MVSRPFVLPVPTDGPQTIHAYLDVNERHAELFGDCLLLRDDDGMGFALCLEKLVGKYVEVTIKPIPEPDGYKRYWKTDAENGRGKR